MRSILLAAVLALAPAAASAQASPPRTLGLDEAVRTALARQPQLRQSRAQAGAADARTDQARAPLLPQVGASAAYERSTSNVASRPGSTSAFSRPDSWSTSGFWSTGVQAGQVIFDGPQLARWRAAGASAEAQHDDARTTLQQVVAGVRAAWFSARAAKDLVQVAKDSLANQDAHLRQVQAFVEVGTRPAIDLAQARADRANARLTLIRAENSAAVANAQLAVAIGLDGAPDFEVADDALPPVEGEDGPLEPLVDEALRARPERASLLQQERAQALSRDGARAGWLPTLLAQTGVTGAGTALDTLTPNWSATLSLGWNLFQGGLTQAQVREADLNLAALRAEDDALRNQVRLEVEQAQLGVRASLAALDATGEALDAARERLRLAEGRYAAGAGSIIELGDAQVAATTAAAQRVQAVQDLARSRSELLRALGRP